jgi:uncharacterized protein (UPF0335 family)
MDHGVSGFSAEQLKSLITRIENLERERTVTSENLRDVFAEAKAEGFDTKIIKKVMKLRRMKQEKLIEEEELTALYMNALSVTNRNFES